MRRSLSDTADILAKKRRHKLWLKIVGVLGCAVVFVTTYALILPAITLEKQVICGLEEHVHSDACYTLPEPVTHSELSCSLDRLGIHVHSADCYGPDGSPVCGYADYVVHWHTAGCYDENGVLVCPLPEIYPHAHTDECYGEALPGGHVHDESCYEITRELACGLEESEGHVHGGTCYDETGALVCALEESEAHFHTDDCYKQLETLICGQEETEQTGTARELTCRIPEVRLHTHTDACYDGGVLICGLLETYEHFHTEACFHVTQEQPEPELTCGLEEHVHTDDCYAPEEPESNSDPTADVETQAQWEATLQDVRLTHDYRLDVLAVARSQLGYTESARNFILDASGVPNGYTRYGAWYGDLYGDWCAMFVSFCLHYAELPEAELPYESGCENWVTLLTQRQNYFEAHPEQPEDPAGPALAPYIPIPGDLIFFSMESGGIPDHVGLVTEYLPATDTEPARVRAIEGNTADAVRQTEYEWADTRILGYAQLPEQEFFCGKTGHVHTDACPADCPIEEHIHTDVCFDASQAQQLTELSYTGEGFSVLVRYGADAQLPEGVTLTAREIAPDSPAYRTYCERSLASIQAADEDVPQTLVFARFLDISFVLNGVIYEPAAPVEVTITYDESVDTGNASDCRAVHFGQNGTELLDVTTEQSQTGETSFTHTQDGFSVVGNVVTRAIGTYANAPTTGLDHNVTFMVKIRDSWVNVGSCTYDTSAVDGRNASVSEDVLHQYLDSYGYSTESDPTGTLKCSYDDIYTIYYAQNGAATNFALDIPSANINEEVYLQLWTANQSSAQTFRIWRVVDNYYFITPLANSGLHVNLPGGATTDGTPLWLHSATDEASWWGIRNNDDGTVSFYSNLKTNAYIDLKDSSQNNGATVQLYESGGNINWKPVKKYDEQDVVAGNGRVGLTAESNGNIVCFYTPSTPLNDPNAIYTAEELSKLGTSGSYYLACDITVDHVNGSAADIGDGASTTLDLNGHTIHYNVPEDQSGSSMVFLHGTGSLTITDSGRAVETTEVVTDLPLYGNLASYDSSTRTLVYYVTESRSNQDGTTTETLVKHTVDLTNVGAVESDTAPYHLIYVANDAVLNIQGGRFTNPNGKRAITAYDNSTVNISGGYLCGSANYGNGIVGGAVHVNSTGALNISGGVIAANRADKAGGVYKNGGIFTMTGGVITGNQVPADANNGADCRGGGVQVDSAVITISGGYITNNRLDYKCDAVGAGCHFGGGITQYGTTMTVAGNCYITGNYSAEAGGGIGFNGVQFIMTGGTVAANVAQTAEGGGIRIQYSEQTSLISGGYITNNRTNSMHDWGGGGIFLVQGNSLQILNAVFQQNTADGFGGGVGGCSTGQIVAVDNTVGGVAIFDNYANGETMSGSDGVANSKQDDLTARANEVFMTNGYNDFFCALNSAVAGTMLGGGAENWHGSCDYQEIDIGKDRIAAANKMMGLNANPSDADKQTAIRQGNVFVSGNYSQTHGGGIMSNGILILGQAEDITLSPGLEIEVYKAFKDANGNELAQQPGQFQFLLQDSNRNTIATVSNNAFGMVLAEQDYTQAGTYTYYLKEQPGSNPLITYDSTEYEITVTVGTKTKTLNLSANQSMTITYYVVTAIQVRLSVETGTATAATSNIDSDNHRATVVIQKDGNTAFTNTMNEKPFYFRITKLNGHTNEPLQFVEFTLKDENGNVVTSGKTDQEGHVSLQIEKGKTYRLYETTYQNFMPAGPWILEADTEGNVIIYDTTTGADGSINKSGAGTACKKDEKDVAVYCDHTILNLIAGCELPNSGGGGTVLYTIGGLALVLSGGILLYIHTKRRKEDFASS